MAHSMEKRIARLEADKVDDVRGRQGAARPLPAAAAPGRTVIEVAGLAKAYGGPPVFEDVDFDLGRGERLLVLGLNGAGKTSLLRILAGETDADRGTVDARATTSPSATTPRSTTTSVATSRCSTTSAARCRPASCSPRPSCAACSACSGCPARRSSRSAGTLSGGEKTKLALAMLMVGRNNLLLLDEPTNNLDPGSRRSVADSLVDWPGALVFVSHDTEFVEQLAPTKVLLMPDGQVDYFSPDWLDLVAPRLTRPRPGAGDRYCAAPMRTGIFGMTVNEGSDRRHGRRGPRRPRPRASTRSGRRRSSATTR